MPDLDEVREQVNKQPGLNKFLGRREIKELPSILWENENVENIIQGNYNNGNGVLVATTKRLIFVDKGLVKLKVEDFPYDKISSLQYETGIIFGKITVFTSGNRAEIKNTTKNETKPFAEYVRARVTKHTDHAAIAPNENKSSPNTDEDVYSKLKKLAELKKQGILTDAEFKEEKRKLLS